MHEMLHSPEIPCWHSFEHSYTSSKNYNNPLQELVLRVHAVDPDGYTSIYDAFWDGGSTWKFRFAPDKLGTWQLRTVCSDSSNTGLHHQTVSCICTPATTASRFEQHGPLRLAYSRRNLEHSDGTPFLWLGDTCWNGPLQADDQEWQHYLTTRVEQGFSVVQWVTTTWMVSPDGDREGQLAYSGKEHIAINPAFFQRLDKYVRSMRSAGLLPVPVLLWAAAWRDETTNSANPGYALAEEQAILLARYMIARWQDGPVVWILNGDGSYLGEQATRWQHIGAALFEGRTHAPVILHPCGKQLPIDEFRHCDWLNLVGYQSGHGDDEATLRWLIEGPPATRWNEQPTRPFINLEPPYEDHIAYQSQQPISGHMVRRALWWSLLIAPMAGVTYGGHGVWGWDNGTAPPVAHETTGIPKPWPEALLLPAAQQLRHIVAWSREVEWWQLMPHQELLAIQPGESDCTSFIAAAASIDMRLAVFYTPAGKGVTLLPDASASWTSARWFNPREGAWQDAQAQANGFMPPDKQDWVLVLQKP